MNLYFKLDGHTPVPCELDEVDFDIKTRLVAETKIDDDCWVSTVFLVINHAWDDGTPVLFETMIFGGEHNEYQKRYCTWEEAEEGHREAVLLAYKTRQEAVRNEALDFLAESTQELNLGNEGTT